MHQNPKRLITKQLRLLPDSVTFHKANRGAIIFSVVVALFISLVSLAPDFYNFTKTNTTNFIFNIVLNLCLSSCLGTIVYFMLLKTYLADNLKVGMALILDEDQTIVLKNRWRTRLLKLVAKLKEDEKNPDKYLGQNHCETLKLRIRNIQLHINSLSKTRAPEVSIYEIMSVRYQINHKTKLEDTVIVLRDFSSDLMKSIYLSDYINSDAQIAPWSNYKDDENF